MRTVGDVDDLVLRSGVVSRRDTGKKKKGLLEIHLCPI